MNLPIAITLTTKQRVALDYFFTQGLASDASYSAYRDGYGDHDHMFYMELEQWEEAERALEAKVSASREVVLLTSVEVELIGNALSHLGNMNLYNEYSVQMKFSFNSLHKYIYMKYYGDLI